jgi:hypothetical protein
MFVFDFFSYIVSHFFSLVDDAANLMASGGLLQSEMMGVSWLMSCKPMTCNLMMAAYYFIYYNISYIMNFSYFVALLYAIACPWMMPSVMQL